MDTIAQIFASAAGNIVLCYYRRSEELSVLERMTDGELRACVFFAVMSVAMGGGAERPRLQITYQGE